METGDDIPSANGLYEAIWADNGDEVASLLQDGADVNAVDGNGSTPLMQACFGGELSMVRALLSAGTDVNARDENGQSALHYAVTGARDEMVASVAKELLDSGSNAEAVDDEGCTPLIFAAFCEPEVITLLLAAGANPNASDHNGMTPLMHAVNEHRNARQVVERVQTLLDGGADPRTKASDGRTALDFAKIQMILVTNSEFTTFAPTMIDGTNQILADLDLEPEMDAVVRDALCEVKGEIQQNTAAAVANFPIVIRLLDSK